MRRDQVIKQPRVRRRLPALPGGGGVVHLVAEYWPFARTGGLAEAVRGLGEYQTAAGLDVTVILPLHRHVRERGTELAPVGDPFAVQLGGRFEPARIWQATGGEAGPRVFFVEHAEFFDRPEIYGEGYDYADNGRRFAFFGLAALEVLPALAPRARVLHSHDWHAAFAPIYLRTTYAGRAPYDRLGAVVTVHNAAFQGHFPFALLAEIGLPDTVYNHHQLEWYDRVNVLKGGIAFADGATTVSPTHAAELRTPEGGFGLHDHYRAMGDRFVGILNGIDADFWDPATDPYLTVHFDFDHLEPKARCKRAAQRTYGLRQRARAPLVAMTARLVEQKGLDLILATDALVELDAQFVFLGRGERRYEDALAALAARAPDRIAVPLAFSERAEHRLLAGADILLMPSLYEPCGLTQMRAQRYGALPVARKVGGLNDTVVDGVSGFLFQEYRAEPFFAALWRAISCYHERPVWTEIVRNAMRIDHGWGPSAERYHDMYRRACAGRTTD